MTDPDAELASALDAFAALLADVGGRRDQGSHEQVESARLLLGEALAADRARTARLAGRVLRLLVLERCATSQLVHPLIAAIGSRATLAALLRSAGEGSWAHRANACSAAYWVAVRHEPVPFDALRELARTDPGRAREQLAEAVGRARANVDPLTDLWPRLWLAAAVCFTACDEPEVRRTVQTAFPLEHPRHLPQAGPLLAAARRIAEDDPRTWYRLLNGSTGYGAAVGGS
ncbi:hypothetical protein ACFV1L_29910 [Kitasatospora sp. NPDC059646]|uniref:hypothetical protein n=1 Tax=Kitasatospora sp. NPDC059646 TaxID=3346893 RepID=UPI0036A921C5